MPSLLQRFTSNRDKKHGTVPGLKSPVDEENKTKKSGTRKVLSLFALDTKRSNNRPTGTVDDGSRSVKPKLSEPSEASLAASGSPSLPVAETPGPGGSRSVGGVAAAFPDTGALPRISEIIGLNTLPGSGFATPPAPGGTTLPTLDAISIQPRHRPRSIKTAGSRLSTQSDVFATASGSEADYNAFGGSVTETESGGETDREKLAGEDVPRKAKKKEKRAARKVVVDDFEMMRVLGKGCAGKVLLVRHRASNGLYALKAITKRDVLAHQELQHTLTEQAVLKRMARESKNPFVVKLWWSFHDKENLFLVMDFHPGGDLATQLARWGRLGWDRTRFYAAEIVEGCEGLHAAGVIYRDLKPENILIGTDGHIALTDFGLSKEFPRKRDGHSSITPSAPPTSGLVAPNWMGSAVWPGRASASKRLDRDMTSTFCGTAEYLAPEVLQGVPYSYEVDWWSFGTILYEMLTGITPFWANNHSDMYVRILQDELQFPDDKAMDQDTKSLIRGLLQRDPALRMCEPRVKEHPYFSMIDWQHVYYKRYIPPYIPPIDPANAGDTQNFDEVFLDMEPVIADQTNSEGGSPDSRSALTTSGGNSPARTNGGGEGTVDVFDGYSFKGRDSVIIDDEEESEDDEHEEDKDDERIRHAEVPEPEIGAGRTTIDESDAHGEGEPSVTALDLVLDASDDDLDISGGNSNKDVVRNRRKGVDANKATNLFSRGVVDRYRLTVFREPPHPALPVTPRSSRASRADASARPGSSTVSLSASSDAERRNRTTRLSPRTSAEQFLRAKSPSATGSLSSSLASPSIRQAIATPLPPGTPEPSTPSQKAASLSGVGSIPSAPEGQALPTSGVTPSPPMRSLNVTPIPAGNHLFTGSDLVANGSGSETYDNVTELEFDHDTGSGKAVGEDDFKAINHENMSGLRLVNVDPRMRGALDQLRQQQESSLLPFQVTQLPMRKLMSGTMSSEEMFQHLVDHGCVDLSSHMDPDQYSTGFVVGGGFGDIWKGRLCNGTEVAIKVWRFSSIPHNGPKPMKRAMREIYHWSKAKHQNIQELMGVILFQGRLGMVSLWMEHGNLREYISKYPDVDRYSLVCGSFLATQILTSRPCSVFKLLQACRTFMVAKWCTGTLKLHVFNFLYALIQMPINLNSSQVNILVDQDGVAKLSDFDHSILSECTLVFSDTTNPGGGTLRWMAPELLLSSEEEGSPPARRNKQTDIYALGMTHFEIVTGQAPYAEYQHDHGVYRALDKKRPPARPAALLGPAKRPELMWSLLMRCWDHDPLARPSARQILEELESLVNIREE